MFFILDLELFGTVCSIVSGVLEERARKLTSKNAVNEQADLPDLVDHYG